MALVRFENVTFQYGIDIIFENINFQVNENDKAGFVGVNGSGKSTLLKIINDELHCDKGDVFFTKGIKIGYLKQEVSYKSGGTLYDMMLSAFSEIHSLKEKMHKLEHMMETAGSRLEKLTSEYGTLLHQYENLDGYNIDVKIGKILSGLGFKKSDFNTSFDILSGGQKSRAGLAKLLLEEPDLLLLDEPTNHLDIAAVEWLEDFLNNYKKALLIVSHDRYFLDKIVGKIFEIDDYRINTYTGNYSAFIQQKTEKILQQEKLYNLQKAEIERKEDFIRRNMAGQKTKQAQSRQKELDKMSAVSPPAKQKKMTLRFNPSKRGGNQVLQAESLSKSYPGKNLFENLNFHVERGEKVGIIGGNGTGKTTLLRIITGEEEPDSGHIKIGSNIESGYFSQHLHNQDQDNTVLDEVWQVKPSLTTGEMRNYLSRFLFYGEDVFLEIKKLSGGEKSRVELAKLILAEVNFLILDEPTNHLDIYSRMALENALADYPGSILVVSHDRYFLDKLVNRIIYFDSSKHFVLEGNYSRFETLKLEKKLLSAEVDQTPKKSGKEEYKNKMREKRRREQIVKKRPAIEIEQEIEKLDEKIKFLENELTKPEVYNNPLKTKKIDNEYVELTARINEVYKEWEDVLASE